MRRFVTTQWASGSPSCSSTLRTSESTEVICGCHIVQRTERLKNPDVTLQRGVYGEHEDRLGPHGAHAFSVYCPLSRLGVGVRLVFWHWVLLLLLLCIVLTWPFSLFTFFGTLFSDLSLRPQWQRCCQNLTNQSNISTRQFWNQGREKSQQNRPHKQNLFVI